MDLIAEQNSKDKVKKALSNQKKPNTKGEGDLAFIEDKEALGEEEVEWMMSEDEEYWYDCIFCKIIFDNKTDLSSHMIICNKWNKDWNQP